MKVLKSRVWYVIPSSVGTHFSIDSFFSRRRQRIENWRDEQKILIHFNCPTWRKRSLEVLSHCLKSIQNVSFLFLEFSNKLSFKNWPVWYHYLTAKSHQNSPLLAFLIHFCPLKMAYLNKRILTFSTNFKWPVWNHCMTASLRFSKNWPLLAFSTIFWPIKLTCLVTLFDNKLQAINKLTIFGIFNELLSTYKM